MRQRLLWSSVVALLVVQAVMPAQMEQQNTIWLAVNVIDRDGHLVSDLKAEDFTINDNGQQRDISVFRNDPLPIAMAIMVDISSSMEANYGLVRRAIASLVSHFQPGDRAVVGAFDALPWIGARFSARPEVIQKSVSDAVAGTLPLCDGDWIDKSSASRFPVGGFGVGTEFNRRLAVHGGSAIWDGAACGIHVVSSDGETPRRIVILMTDGQDTMSNENAGTVVTRANQAGVMIYSVALMGGYGMNGGDLKAVAESTGGGYFYLTGEKQVSTAFERIGDELRHQCVLGFSSNGPVDGPHNINVTSRIPDRKLKFRRVLMGGVPPALSVASTVPANSAPMGDVSPRSPLPDSLLGGSMPSTKELSRNPVVRGVRSSIVTDLLDRFVRKDWQTDIAPRMTIDQLRTIRSMLLRDGEDWVRAVPSNDQPSRRLAAAGLVLDLLDTQYDPLVWTENQPGADLLDWAADVLSRSSRPFSDERLWYLGAAALLEREGAAVTLERLLLRASRRFPDEPRFVLARGVAEDMRTWPEPRDVHTFTVQPDIASRLIARYEEAAKIPAIRTEALLRLAFFEIRRGRVDAALERFQQIGDVNPEDPILRFWLHLLKGRAAETAGHLADATALYEQAIQDGGAPASARSALIAVLVKEHRAREAARIASEALSQPAESRDPWGLYAMPDMRFLDPITARLRAAVTK